MIMHLLVFQLAAIVGEVVSMSHKAVKNFFFGDDDDDQTKAQM